MVDHSVLLFKACPAIHFHFYIESPVTRRIGRSVQIIDLVIYHAVSFFSNTLMVLPTQYVV